MGAGSVLVLPSPKSHLYAGGEGQLGSAASALKLTLEPIATMSSPVLPSAIAVTVPGASGTPTHEPLMQVSPTVQGSRSSQPVPVVGAQLTPSHFEHCGHSLGVPKSAGLPPQCQPALTTPTPGLETITEPSSETVAGPMLTK